MPIPTSYLYYMFGGNLKSTPQYGGGITESKENVSLPGNYALVYFQKLGGITSNSMKIKVFIMRPGDHEIKEFHSSKYGDSPKYLREVVEKYIKDQLSNPQQLLDISRKRKSSKTKIKRKHHTK